MKIMGSIGRALLVLAVFAGAYLGSSAAVSHIKTRRWLERPPAPGRLVDIGGLRLYAADRGTGPFTVVIEGALGASSAEWWAVQAQIAPAARVITYDRAGIGWSEAAAAPRTPRQAARELNALLDALGVRTPVVLVGHALGGWYAQAFARLYPARTAGVVFVDPMADPRAWLGRLDDGLVRRFIAKDRMLRLLSWTAPLGLQRLMPIPHPVSEPIKQSMLSNWSSAKTVRTMQAEYRAAALADSAPATLGAFPAVPVKVLMHDPDAGLALLRSRRAAPAEAEAVERVSQDLARAYLSLSPAHERIVSSGGANLLHLEAPGMVAGAVKKMLRELMTQSSHRK